MSAEESEEEEDKKKKKKKNSNKELQASGSAHPGCKTPLDGSPSSDV